MEHTPIGHHVKYIQRVSLKYSRLLLGSHSDTRVCKQVIFISPALGVTIARVLRGLGNYQRMLVKATESPPQA